MRGFSAMRALAWLVLAVAGGGCTQSFDYEAKLSFAASAGTVRLNHAPIAPGAVWAASYASFADALRNPSIVEIGDRTLTIGPDACAAACADCDFDRAQLEFTIAADGSAVVGTCGDGERVVIVR
jgi:hypothetical protein